MGRILLLVFITVALMCTEGYTQRNYRVLGRNGINYNLPPHTNLRFKSNTTTPQRRFRYFYIIIRHLSDDYSTALRSFQDAERWNGHIDYFAPTSDKSTAKDIREADLAAHGCDCPIKAGSFFKAAFLRNDGTSFFMQFDYTALNNGNPLDNFSSLMTEVLKNLASLEGVNTCVCTTSIKWPEGFSFQLAKKLKEWLPLPANMPQPGTGFTNVPDQSDFMLIDDDMVLKADITRRVEVIVGQDTKFEIDWNGTDLISFKRSEDGSVIQNDFAIFKNGLPNNRIGTNLYKISSFADIQESSELKTKRYLALFHPPLKRNNDIASTSGSYSPNDDSKPDIGNAFFLHFRSAEIAMLDFTQLFGSGDGYTKSILSDRCSIKPMIPIYINGEEKLAGIFDKVSDLKNVPGKYKLYRKFGSGYRKVKGNKTSVILLPNDHINYSL